MNQRLGLGDKLRIDIPWHTKKEVNATVTFLLTDDAGYIIGTALAIDGGFLTQ
jgi:NAD(P)-dependent dehydrogenase (short-subunit alcohol dehydrogenase family)